MPIFPCYSFVTHLTWGYDIPDPFKAQDMGPAVWKPSEDLFNPLIIYSELGGESVVGGERTEDSGHASWVLKEKDNLFDVLALLFY